MKRHPIVLSAALETMADGRDHVNTKEFAKLTNHAPQTIRKNYSVNGHCFGVKPLKLGNLLLWSIHDIQKVLKGGWER